MPSKRTSFQLLTPVLAAIILLTTMPPAQASDQPPFEIRFPQEPAMTEFDSTFGAGRSGGRRHKGNDLMAPKMTGDYAIAEGVVETVRESGNAGRYVTIEHTGGWSSSYMHLNNDDPGTDNGRADWALTVGPGIEEGAVVTAGQLIGYVGDSGNAEWTGSHTHFELRIDGRAVNPYDLLYEAYRRDLTRHIWNLWPLTNQLGVDQAA